jgi:preprotein translocase subunit SecE
MQELLRTGIYKRTQGRITRQVTCAAIWLSAAAGCWQLYITLHNTPWIAGALGGIEYWLPTLLAVLLVWLGYRLVNYPPFTDFLIGVEAEMAKVSWPGRTELVRASIVVLVMIFGLAVVLYGFDWFWRSAFQLIGVIPRDT